jgi:hypothetical protein
MGAVMMMMMVLMVLMVAGVRICAWAIMMALALLPKNRMSAY